MTTCGVELLRKGFHLVVLLDEETDPVVRPAATKLFVPAIVWNPSIPACQLVCREAGETTSLESPLLSLGVRARGTDLFPLLPAPFFNAYMPLRYTDATTVVAH